MKLASRSVKKISKKKLPKTVNTQFKVEILLLEVELLLCDFLTGSIREHTRAFFNNEVDVHISLNKVLRNWFFFDQDNQQLRANKNLEDEQCSLSTLEDM